MTIGFRNRPTDFAIDDIDALKCMDPSQNKETKKKSCACIVVARCMAATGQTG
jgi:hypothetical protein